MIGSTIGSYRITELLGEGGMGAVYKATDNIERKVAIKALRPQLTHDATRLERFRSEAIALGRLHHPNIASLFHLLEENETFYMVMEFVDGQTLEELISRNGALPPRLALDVLIDGLHGFEHAHSRGVVHRDIKTSNLMVSTEGSTKITDFGIARMDGGARLTQTGQRIGTLEYMSPEQVRGLEQDARSDIYSLGILLFELLTGRVPFTDANDFELMRAHLEKAPPSARFLVPSLPPALDEIIARALAKDPQARFANVAEMRAALEAVAAAMPVDPITSAPVAAPTSQPVRATTLKTPNERYGTMQMEDRYGTRLQGSPLPVIPPAPVDQTPVAPAPPVPAPQPSPPKPAARPWMLAALAAGGIALLVVVILAWGALHSSTPHQGKPIFQPPRTAIRHAAPKRAGAVSKRPSAHAAPRRSGHRIRTVEKPKRHRAAHEVVLRRSPATAPAKSRQLSNSGERAALRAIIKGD